MAKNIEELINFNNKYITKKELTISQKQKIDNKEQLTLSYNSSELAKTELDKQISPLLTNKEEQKIISEIITSNKEETNIETTISSQKQRRN